MNKPPTTPKAYLDSLDEPRRSELVQLDSIIRKARPELEVKFAQGMIGYGPYRYRYASGHEGKAFKIAIASRKAAISIYVTAANEKGWLPEQLAASLGKVKVGRACVGVRRLADLDLGGFRKLLALAKRMGAPGEVG
jgi:Domain of unknown function (DU1801)